MGGLSREDPPHEPEDINPGVFHDLACPLHGSQSMDYPDQENGWSRKRQGIPRRKRVVGYPEELRFGLGGAMDPAPLLHPPPPLPSFPHKNSCSSMKGIHGKYGERG